MRFTYWVSIDRKIIARNLSQKKACNMVLNVLDRNDNLTVHVEIGNEQTGNVVNAFSLLA